VTITALIATGTAVLGFAVCYLALRGVARWCPGCGARLSCAKCVPDQARVPSRAATHAGSRALG
jgi:hypothetical protein